MSLPIFSWPPPAGQYVHCARYPVVHYAAEIRAQCTTGKHYVQCALTSKFNLQIRILKIPFETIFLFDMIYLPRFFRNERFMLDEIVWRDASKFATFLE